MNAATGAAHFIQQQHTPTRMTPVAVSSRDVCCSTWRDAAGQQRRCRRRSRAAHLTLTQTRGSGHPCGCSQTRFSTSTRRAAAHGSPLSRRSPRGLTARRSARPLRTGARLPIRAHLLHPHTPGAAASNKPPHTHPAAAMPCVPRLCGAREPCSWRAAAPRCRARCGTPASGNNQPLPGLHHLQSASREPPPPHFMHTHTPHAAA